MPRSFAAGAMGLWLASLPFAATAEQAVVVELYTSQGCSSCPPADAFLGELARDPRVIPLALHVDYWDYIGWADSFARPEFTRRQHGYAKANGEKMVYTPQFVVAGQLADQTRGSDSVLALIAEHSAVAPDIQVTARRNGATLTLLASARESQPYPLSVQLVRYLPQTDVEISRGENAGRKITYHNTVASWERLAEWDGQTPLDITAPIEGDLPAVIIIQRAGPGPILAAARVE